jgi:Ca2+-binding RTX toxin-like protein
VRAVSGAVALRVIGLSILLVAAVAAPSAAVHDDRNSSCTYADGTIRLVIASQHVVQLLAIEDRIEYADLSDYSHRGQCGRATVRNTDRVRVTETIAGTTRFQLRQWFQRLGPGRTVESTGISEIEVYLGTVEDVWLLGRPVRDAVTIGTGGINLNGDGDADLIGGAIGQLYAFLDDGDDSFSASGGRGTGDPWVPARTLALTVDGNDGDDVISGSQRGDNLEGFLGRDRISGLGGPDSISAGSHQDVVYGGNGNDFIDPGPWPDTVFAGYGDDHIRAHDWDTTGDTLSGGPGTDAAVVDDYDQVSGVEKVSTGAP